MTSTYLGKGHVATVLVRLRKGPCHGFSRMKGCIHSMAPILPIKRFFLDEFMLADHDDVRLRKGPCHGCSQVKGCTHVMAPILPIMCFFFLEEFTYMGN